MSISDRIIQDVRAALEARPRGPHRHYFGASGFHGKCRRAKVMTFRDIHRDELNWRGISRTETGDVWEDRIVDRLREAGYTVVNTIGGLRDEFGADIPGDDHHQIEVSAHHGHFKGHIDGLIRAPGERLWRLLEVKAMVSGKYEWNADTGVDAYDHAVANRARQDKRQVMGAWFKVKKQGVKRAKPEHWWQMQCYMWMLGLCMDGLGIDQVIEEGVYVCMNTDLDQLEVQLVHADESEWAYIEEESRAVISARVLPTRVGTPGTPWSPCRFCPHVHVCHEQLPHRRSCKSCTHGAAGYDGTWVCRKKQGLERVRSEHDYEACDGWEQMGDVDA